jgi:hypothetical protein
MVATTEGVAPIAFAFDRLHQINNGFGGQEGRLCHPVVSSAITFDAKVKWTRKKS